MMERTETPPPDNNSNTSSTEPSIYPAELLEKKVWEVGPHVYELLIPEEQDKVEFIVFGCQGSGKKAQIDTAKLMDEVADKSNVVCAFGAGDNVYDWGANSPYAPVFQDFFHRIYTNSIFKKLNNLPFWMALGNHDGNFHAKARLSLNPTGEKTEIQEVEHSYIDNPDEKTTLYKKHFIDPKELPQWNMPYFFYSVIVGDVQVFILDSSTLPKDYLNLITNQQPPNKVNQVEWLRTEIAKANNAGRKIAGLWHHPFYTCGKRALSFDSQHYLYDEEISQLNKHLGNDNPSYKNTLSYNELLANIFRKEKINFDLVLAAHDHFLAHYHNKDHFGKDQGLIQLTVGGGGGDLQHRSSYSGHPHVEFLDQNGFWKITRDKKANEFLFDLYTTDGHHLTFSNKSPEPQREISNDAQFELLRKKVLNACDTYLAQLKTVEDLSRLKQQNNNSGLMYSLFSKSIAVIGKGVEFAMSYMITDYHKTEMSCLHQLKAYFNQPTPPPLEKALEFFKNQMQKIAVDLVVDNSFYPLIKNLLSENLKEEVKLESLFEKKNELKKSY